MKSELSGPKRVGIFSDIHGNMHALQSVLSELEKEEVDFTLCCGDVVGYGGNPNECVEVLRERQIPTIAGNHDFAALNLVDITYFNDIAREAIVWTRQEMKPENMDWLKELPLSIEVEDMLFVHASPNNPESWNYIITMGQARIGFQYFGQRVCFIGHSHTPFIVENNDGELSCPETPQIKMRENCRYLVNVGSVGQPRDRHPDACYAIYDREARTVEIRRVGYDMAGAQNSILSNGLPTELAERLAFGL
jgi:diadenosine tetraphosphatase ApaH/serine/threonine PP2A family protein phosphatase